VLKEEARVEFCPRSRELLVGDQLDSTRYSWLWGAGFGLGGLVLVFYVGFSLFFLGNIISVAT
jgi:hypothetical protein